MNIHGRHGALITALFAVLALALPASALAGHDLRIYKVEKQVDLDSDDTDATGIDGATAVNLSCRTGDLATDGMWRVDHADQDDDELANTSFLAESVDVPEAYPRAIDTYHFRFVKNAVGRVQAKVFLTCLSTPTEPNNGHDHDIQTTLPTAAGWAAGTITVSNPVGVNQAWTSVPTAIAPGTYSSAAICPTNTFIAQPGYKYAPTGADPALYSGRLSKSTMSSNMRGWTWEMDLRSDPAAAVTFYALCIRTKVAVGGTPSESHKLVYRYVTDSGAVAATSAKTLRISCRSSYKALVGGFSFTFGDLYFLGMDPQPKSRDFRFLNPNGSSKSANLAAICLNSRTT